MLRSFCAAVLLSVGLVVGCSSEEPTGPVPGGSDPKANVTNVTTSGSPQNYQFTVTVRSPDEGCAEYADWWEVLSQEGELIYRRTIDEPHVDEQPFTTTGGPVEIPEDQLVIVRAHMREAGYGGQAFEGAPGTPNAFDPVVLPDSFAFDLDDVSPQPAYSCE
jgi:hypothetical protein